MGVFGYKSSQYTITVSLQPYNTTSNSNLQTNCTLSSTELEDLDYVCVVEDHLYSANESTADAVHYYEYLLDISSSRECAPLAFYLTSQTGNY